MTHERQFYTGGTWVAPATPAMLDVIDPSTEEAFTQIAIGSAADVDRAVAAARAAFPAFARTTRSQRLELLRAILAEYRNRYDDVAETLSREMGAPLEFARSNQAAMGTAHLERMIADFESFRFEWMQGSTLIAKEPIGVIGMITPWLADQPNRLQGGAGHRRRLHDGAKAIGGRAAQRHHLVGSDARGWRSSRRL